MISTLAELPTVIFIPPPPITKEQLYKQGVILSKQGVFMWRNDLTLNCKIGYAKRIREVSGSVIPNSKIIRENSSIISKPNSLGLIRPK